jgi:hypothetical protein
MLRAIHEKGHDMDHTNVLGKATKRLSGSPSSDLNVSHVPSFFVLYSLCVMCYLLTL